MKRSCSIELCGRDVFCRGMCRRHYEGDAVRRLYERVDRRPAGCWLWTGTIAPNGYGYFAIKGRSQQAHRVAYELLVGPIPDGLDLDHLCRVRACVNPDHLEPVTRSENNRRGFEARKAEAIAAGTWVPAPNEPGATPQQQRAHYRERRGWGFASWCAAYDHPHCKGRGGSGPCSCPCHGEAAA